MSHAGAADPSAVMGQPVYAPDVFGFMSYHPGHGPPHGPAGPVHDPVAASIRNQVVDRLLRMNVKHAWHAWAKRRLRPVAAHGLAFCYAHTVDAGDERTGRPPRYRVSAATRLFDDAPDVADLARLLYRLTELARTRYAPAFDPRAHMSNRTDAGMPAWAHYIGLGVSSLDIAEASWPEVQRRATDAAEVPGRCLAVLSDDTMLLMHRGARDVFDQVDLWSTHDLNMSAHRATRPWGPATAHQLTAVPGLGAVWPRLHELHTLILQQAPRGGPSRPGG